MNDYEYEKREAERRAEWEAELDRTIKEKAKKQAIVVLVIGACLAVGVGLYTKSIGVSAAACLMTVFGFLPNCYVPVFKRYMEKKNRER